LIIECSWRITHAEEIVMASASEEVKLLELPNILVGRTIESIDVHGDFNDLTLGFNGN